MQEVVLLERTQGRHLVDCIRQSCIVMALIGELLISILDLPSWAQECDELVVSLLLCIVAYVALLSGKLMLT